MQCPKCFEFLPPDVKQGKSFACPHCGADVALFVEIASIREGVRNIESTFQSGILDAARNLQTTKNHLQQQFAHLQQRLQKLEARPLVGAPTGEVTSAAVSDPELSAPPVEQQPGQDGLEAIPAGQVPESPARKAQKLQEKLQEKLSVREKARQDDLPTGAQVAAKDGSENAADGSSPALPRAVAAGIDEAAPSRRPVSPPKPPSRPAPTLEEESLFAEVGLGQRVLLIVGIVFLILGTSFFVKYAFDNNWVTPAGRVALSYLFGAALLGVGELFRRRNLSAFGLYLIGGGIATFYISTYSAFQYYKIIEQPLAFVIMVLVTTLAGGLSLFYDNIWLSVLGLIGGFATPILVSTGTDNMIGLFTYMTILNVGILGIAVFKDWTLLNYLGFLSTWILYSGWYGQHYRPEKFWAALFFNNVFFSIYSVLPFAEFLMRSREKPAHQFSLANFALSVPNTLWSFGFSYSMITAMFSQEYTSIVSVVYAAAFAGMAHFIYQRNKNNLEPFILLLAKALTSLVVTVPLLFSGHWITIFWSIQAFAFLLAGWRLSSPALFQSSLVVLGISVIHFVFWDWHTFWAQSTTGYMEHFVARMITCVTFFTILFQFARQTVAKFKDTSTGYPLYGLFAVLLLAAVTFEDMLFFSDYLPQARTASISVVWSLFSITMIVIGFLQNLPVVRKCAIGLFGVTIMKVFFIDMASASTPFRIVSSMVLGLMLVGASFLYHRFRDHILAAVESTKENE